MEKQVDLLKQRFLDKIEQVADERQLEEVRILFLGRKGELASYFNLMGSLSQDDRPKVGKKLNLLKSYIQESIEQKAKELTPRGRSVDFFDVTLPGVPAKIGTKHPINQVLDEIKSIFISLGFVVETGPELETDYYNFEALNIPENHPSRDLQDTFYITDKLLLRTHTSPVQIRTMERMSPPVRMIAPGKCYRKDTPDATHSPVFHQVEGLCVDVGVTFADLKGVINAFAKRLFGSEMKIRFRPSFFPFTEPSAEYDFSCIICGGKGCNVCKGTGWLEISGAGMVDPAVFQFVNYDSEKYTGYAFGMGVERIAMLKYGIDDIRTFFENDLRFLNQF
ncbi:MAG: phenylalanine--tRNA ligase subunit alpha [candidate division KSB1 bacterium]|nr:phenylalanine--tRNA ligase subunit alpha [candidate division KSB1 bacterium]MDZ7335991.1 phenylalanine--tRNA ligase subunit alpha [candidate division KSB1 bacterium]MDZ7358284.1 phenylalanine--tRNA ligase subunit alpha [candidate division KSB1 bacterium]MDZ7376039.1 phenylalanine--tRNA ligase subunit alpha [candidate division KSB1 bacterium]MDZ7401397.1 phenylalanine--tRNA ligase subunit alpha [candidate division KSB1 bacterium]